MRPVQQSDQIKQGHMETFFQVWCGQSFSNTRCHGADSEAQVPNIEKHDSIGALELKLDCSPTCLINSISHKRRKNLRISQNENEAKSEQSRKKSQVAMG